MRSVGLVALGWRVPGAQAQGMVRACEQGAGREQCTWQVGRVLWLWGSERASEVTGARDGSAYGSLKKLTEAVEFKSVVTRREVRRTKRTPILPRLLRGPTSPNRPSPNPTRQERPHASLLALHKALRPGGRPGTAHMAMHIAHSSATYGSAHRAPLAHRRSLRAVRTLSLSQSCPIPPARAPERSPSSTPHGRHRSHF
jgi:hypothetical protein